jgi:hypothetical protein
MELTQQERERRSEQAKRNWADPAVRAKMIEGARKPRPGRAVGLKERQAKREKARLHSRKRRLAYHLSKPASAKTDLRSVRTELTALKPLLPLADWEKLEEKYHEFRYRVIYLRLLEKERRTQAWRKQWAEAE